MVRQLKFLIVAIEYFTKWIEAKALATITEKNMQSFVWRHIICGMGSLGSWSQTMGNNSTMTPSRIFAHS